MTADNRMKTIFSLAIAIRMAAPLITVAVITTATMSASLFSAPTAAADIELPAGKGEHCSIDIHGLITVGPDFIETRTEKGSEPIFTFQAPDQLAIGDVGLVLTLQQQELMQAYRSGLHASGREVSYIAVEAVDAVLNGLGAALSALAGPDDPDTQEFFTASKALRQQAYAQIAPPGEVFTFGDDALGDLLADEITPQIEVLAKKSAGIIAWHAIGAVFTGGHSAKGDAKLASKAAKRAVEGKKDQLEARGQALCKRLYALEDTEQQLHAAIPELKGLDLIATN